MDAVFEKKWYSTSFYDRKGKMINITLSAADSQLQSLVSGLEMVASKMLPSTTRAFSRAAKGVVAYVWRAYAMGAPIEGSTFRIKNPSGSYAKSIKVVQLSAFNYVVYSDSPLAVYIEEGTKEVDLKETHPFGRKSRVVKHTVRRKGKIIRKEGDSYLIVPLRHQIPGGKGPRVLPTQLYNRLRREIKNDQFKLSQVAKGTVAEKNASGEIVRRRKYNWGSRLSDSSIADNLAGMVAMDIGTSRQTRSGYFTFRVISVNSAAHKWIRPAMPGKHIAKSVADNTASIIQDMIAAALKKDLGISD